MRFWDSSALVPLLIGQPASPVVDRWYGEDDVIALWTLAPIEVASALRRLVRGGAVPEAAALEAEERLDQLVSASHVVVDIEGVKAGARRLLRVHSLRAADSLQLAAALAWSTGEPGRIFHAFDGRLGAAARREGFRVLPEPQ